MAVPALRLAALQAAQRGRELQEQINRLLREFAKTEGELAASRAAKPKG